MFNYISFFLSFLFAEENSSTSTNTSTNTSTSTSTGNTQSEYSYFELICLCGSIVAMLQAFVIITYFLLTYFEVL